MKKFIPFFMFAIIFLSCNSNVINQKSNDLKQDEQVIFIGDEIIYGESFSFEQLYNDELENFENAARQLAARAAEESSEIEFSDDDFVGMVYFSVQPTSIESLKKINDTLGYLNPVQLDKEIIQACDAENIIFKKDIEISDDINLEEVVNFDVKYYYICPKYNLDIYEVELEGFDVIEEFDVLSEEAVSRIENEYSNMIDDFESSSRGLFSKIANGIKKAVQAVKSFIVDKYEINGTVYYSVAGYEEPAYGIRVSGVPCFGTSFFRTTDKKGEFSFAGGLPNSAGLCTISVNFYNKACKLTNFLGVEAPVILKTDWPSKLVNTKIVSKNDYVNAKMAICNDVLRRYDDESLRHSGIPQAIIWTQKKWKIEELLADQFDFEFNHLSSAPCFHYRGKKNLPDIIMTGVQAKSIGTLKTFHHEYTHFLHCVYTENKNDFWDNIIYSEVGCTIADATVEFIDLFFEGDAFSTGYADGLYNFKNPYVCFAENLAEWYSYVGCYGQGDVGKKMNITYGNGDTPASKIYDNTELFTSLVINLFNYYGVGIDDSEKKQSIAAKFLQLIDEKNIITFAEFYEELIKKYPNQRNLIQATFKSKYKQYGSKVGNIINY